MFCLCSSCLTGVSYLGVINWKGGGSFPDWLWFDSSTQIEMLQKIFDGESLQSFPKKVYDGVCLIKFKVCVVKTGTLL